MRMKVDPIHETYNDMEVMAREVARDYRRARKGLLTRSELLDLQDQLEYCRDQEVNRATQMRAVRLLTALADSYPTPRTDA